MIGVAVAAVVIVAVLAAVFLSRFANQPGQTSPHGDLDGSTSGALYGTADRPAGPDVDDIVTPDAQAEPDGGIRSASSPSDAHEDPS